MLIFFTWKLLWMPEKARSKSVIKLDYFVVAWAPWNLRPHGFCPPPPPDPQACIALNSSLTVRTNNIYRTGGYTVWKRGWEHPEATLSAFPLTWYYAHLLLSRSHGLQSKEVRLIQCAYGWEQLRDTQSHKCWGKRRKWNWEWTFQTLSTLRQRS